MLDRAGALLLGCEREPVLVVQLFDTEEEAIRLANDTIYGLAGGVFTGSPAFTAPEILSGDPPSQASDFLTVSLTQS